MIKTRNNIYLDLKYSTYKFSYKEVTLFFSSEFYLYNLINRLEKETNRIQDKYPFNIDLTILAMIDLYLKIEKRGIYIEVDQEGEILVWQSLKEISLGIQVNSKD